MISRYILVILINRDADLGVVDTEIKIKDLLLKAHLALNKLADVLEVVVYGLFDVYRGTLDPLHELFDFREPLYPASEPQIAPPPLQALRRPLLNQLFQRVLLRLLKPSPE